MEKCDLLERIVTAIGITYDINKVLNTICKELLEVFQADRVAISSYSGVKRYYGWSGLSEYRANSTIPTLHNFHFSPKTQIYLKNHVLDRNQETIIDNIQESNQPVLFKREQEELGTKSLINIPIRMGSAKWGILGIFQNTYYRHWTKEEIELLHEVINYIYIAIRQAELYTSIENQAEREKLLAEIIELTRSTLDINQIKYTIVSELGKLFNADRCLIREYDENNKIFLPPSPDAEYLSSPKVKSLVGIKLSSNMQNLLGKKILEGDDIVFSNDTGEFIETNDLKNTTVEGFFRGFFIKSGILRILFIHNNKILGTLGIHFTKRKYIFSKEDIDFIKTVVGQTAIALYQAQLYKEANETAEREAILREIVTELKPLQNIEDTFNNLLDKIGNIYNATRAILIEMPVEENRKFIIRCEYLKNENLNSLKNIILPKSFQRILKNNIEILSPLIIPDTKYWMPDNVAIQDFFKTYSIQSFIVNPLVEFNYKTKLLGIIFICDNKPRDWTSREIHLLKALNETVAHTIWEIIQTVEMNRLRDTFINTLAHDLQVPIVGDIKALEFLASRPDTQSIGLSKNIIDEALNNDKRILVILKNLLENYQYESGKKELKLAMVDLKSIINGVVDSKKSMADSKDISIKVIFHDKLPQIKLDKGEIYKVIYTLLDNAVTYTQNGGKITINVKHNDGHVTVCIADDGPGIPPRIKEMIFKRYEMTVETQRKIGAGISLCLARQIIEAHKGNIWCTTELGKGTTFCLTLPIK